MIIFFLGRQPEISLAELSAVYGVAPRLLARNIAALDIDNATALAAASRLGSIIKIAEVIDDCWTVEQSHIIRLANRLFSHATGKITLGISYYDPRASRKSAADLGKTIQDYLKEHGRSVRLLPADQATLSTAAVLHNGLAHGNPKKVELNLVKPKCLTDKAALYHPTDSSASSLSHYLVAKTIYVQDIDAYAWRDRRRPRRDAHNGMLPPKLAQIMLNLAIGSKADRLAIAKSAVLDPFCGTGVVLQEAALMGMTVYGTDINSRMVSNTKANLDWLAHTSRQAITAQLATADATTFNWASWVNRAPINVVVTEAYLGRPYVSTPSQTELKNNIGNCNVIVSKFLRNLAKQLPSGAGLCIGVPAWYIRDHINHLPCINNVEAIGYRNQTMGANLIYHRPDQIVGRELLVLQKR